MSAAHQLYGSQAAYDLAQEDFTDYDRREEMKLVQQDEAKIFSARMAADKLDDDAFYDWADNGGTETLAAAFEDDNDRIFLQLVIRAHQHDDLKDLTGPIIERLKKSAELHRMEDLTWLTD